MAQSAWRRKRKCAQPFRLYAPCSMRYADLRMRKAEIAAKFDEIVAFSEVEKFIDTPVKRYSSGTSRRSVRAKTDMYVRLAFAANAILTAWAFFDNLFTGKVG